MYGDYIIPPLPAPVNVTCAARRLHMQRIPDNLDLRRIEAHANLSVDTLLWCFLRISAEENVQRVQGSSFFPRVDVHSYRGEQG